MTIEVRDARAADLPAALDIYNELIETTTVAWTERKQTLAEREAWFDEQRRRGFPTLVAVDGEDVVGVTAFGDFRDSVHWPGYRFTAELSIHVRGDHCGTGVGSLLLETLIARARALGIHVLVAGIDAENLGSIRFHERFGFVEVARMPETGFKFGRWLDLVLMQLVVGAAVAPGAGSPGAVAPGN
jgi:L-amino acid N-acyltransferase